MRALTAAVLAVTLTSTSLLAAPLAPGKPAGVTKAQGEDAGLYWLLGLSAVGGLVVITQTDNGKGALNQINVATTPVSTGTR